MSLESWGTSDLVGIPETQTSMIERVRISFYEAEFHVECLRAQGFIPQREIEDLKPDWAPHTNTSASANEGPIELSKENQPGPVDTPPTGREQKMDSTAFERFNTIARAHQIDPSLGFLLQFPEYMQKDNYVCGRLLKLCKDNDIDIDQYLFQDLADSIKRSEIAYITPQAYVVSRTKATTLAMYREKQEKWGIHLPFFFQTCPGSLFYIYRTAPDALHAMLDILEYRQAYYTKPIDGSKTLLEVNWILEHVVDDNPCYALYDLDDYPHRYQGRIGDQEIERLIGSFPGRFITLLIESNCIEDSDETLVEVRLKNRSRWVKEKNCHKISYHCIFSTFAPKATHRAAVASCLQRPFNDEMSIKAWLSTTKRAVETTGDYSSLPTEMLTQKDSLAALLSLDPAALPGGANGITTFYSVKQRGEVTPTHGPTTIYNLGMPISVTKCQYPPPHDFSSAHMSAQDRLRLLHSLSYTIPKRFMTFYTEELIQKASLAATSVDDKTEVSPFIYFQLGLAGESNPAP